MHLTTGETALISSAVASLAIAASWGTTSVSLRRQQKRAHEEWLRDRRAETYIDVLRQAEIERARLLGADGASAEDVPVSTFDQSVDLAARLNAFGSPKILGLYNQFRDQTDLFSMVEYTVVHEGGASSPAIPREVETARLELVQGIRTELQGLPVRRGGPGWFSPRLG